MYTELSFNSCYRFSWIDIAVVRGDLLHIIHCVMYCTLMKPFDPCHPGPPVVSSVRQELQPYVHCNNELPNLSSCIIQLPLIIWLNFTSNISYIFLQDRCWVDLYTCLFFRCYRLLESQYVWPIFAKKFKFRENVKLNFREISPCHETKMFSVANTMVSRFFLFEHFNIYVFKISLL